MKEHGSLRIAGNVYWISATVAARHGHARRGWRSYWPGLPSILRSAANCDKSILCQADAVAGELEELLKTRFPYTIGLALTGGVATASLLAIV